MTVIFNDPFTGSNGAAWSGTWSISNTGTAGTATIQGNQGQQNAGSSSTNQLIAAYTGSNVAALELSGKFTFSSSSTNGFSEIWVRGDLLPSANCNGYFLSLKVGSKPVLAKGNSCGFNTIATLSSAPTIAQSSQYGFKLYAVGTTIKAKVWLISGGEPVSYDFSGTDSTHTSAGKIWIATNNGAGTTNHTTLWDDVQLTDGTANDAAGTSAGTATTSGTVTAILAAAGTSAGATTVTGNAIRFFSAAGTVAGTTTVSGNPIKALPQVSGTVAATSTTVGTLGAARAAVSGLTAATGATVGAARLVAGASGTVAATATTSGTAGLRYGISGTVAAVGTTRGSILVAGKPGQGNEVLVLFDENEVLEGGRVTYYQFDLLDADENLIGQLEGVTSGEITIDAYSAVKSTGKLSVLDRPGQVVDWLNVRIRPMIRIARLGGGDDPMGKLVPAGVFLCAAPVEDYSDVGMRRDVELADKLSILDQDIASGDPVEIVAYSAPAGANIITLVQNLIAETGELYPAIQADTKVLAAPMVWDLGKTRLQIINDLLDVAGYFSLFCDGWGQYQAVPYVQPADRVPVYESIAPFSDGARSLMDPAWRRDRDIYSIPNRYLVVGQGDGTNAALVSLATNVDPESPYSFPSRGRWITATEIGVEAADQSTLDTIARARLSRAASVTNQITLRHVFLPDLHVNSVVKFVNPGAALDTYCYVVNTSIPLDPTALCSTTMRLVT